MPLKGYNFIHKGSPSNAGVGLFLKEDILYTATQSLNLNVFQCEDLWIQINQKEMHCFVRVIYRHPHQNIKVFHESLEKNLDALKSCKGTYYITGDININSLKRGTDNVVKIILI